MVCVETDWFEMAWSGGSYNNFEFGPDVSSEWVVEQGVEMAWYASGLTRNSQIKHGLPIMRKYVRWTILQIKEAVK